MEISDKEYFNHSNTYVQTLYTQEVIADKVKQIGQQITNDYKDTDEELIVICLLKGGFMFTSDLVKNIKRDVIVDFMIVSSYGDSQVSSDNVIIKKDIGREIKDKHVIIVDDIIDTGLTLHEITKLLMKRKPKSIKTCCLLNKEEKRTKNTIIDYYGFICPDKYVYGYGMDLKDHSRNLPYICFIEPSICDNHSFLSS
tara:strand:+ start:429 stop:1022 length:594 start_codon:yes stop_codon:yes gene_type:complete